MVTISKMAEAIAVTPSMSGTNKANVNVGNVQTVSGATSHKIMSLKNHRKKQLAVGTGELRTMVLELPRHIITKRIQDIMHPCAH
jgi:hypothetical protein